MFYRWQNVRRDGMYLDGCEIDARNHYQERHGAKYLMRWYGWMEWCKGEDAVFEEEEKAWQASEEGIKYRTEVELLNRMKRMKLATSKRREKKKESVIAKRVLYRRNNRQSRDYHAHRSKKRTINLWRYDVRRRIAEPRLMKRLQKKIDLVWNFISKRILGRKFREWLLYLHRYRAQEDIAYRYIHKWLEPELANSYRKWKFVVTEHREQRGWLRWSISTLLGDEIRCFFTPLTPSYATGTPVNAVQLCDKLFRRHCTAI